MILLKFSLVSVDVGLFKKPRKKTINIDTYSHTMGCEFDLKQWTDYSCRSLQRAKQSSGLLLSLWALFKCFGETLTCHKVNI